MKASFFLPHVLPGGSPHLQGGATLRTHATYNLARVIEELGEMEGAREPYKEPLRPKNPCPDLKVFNRPGKFKFPHPSRAIMDGTRHIP